MCFFESCGSAGQTEDEGKHMEGFLKCNSTFSCPFITSWLWQQPQRLRNQWETLLVSPDSHGQTQWIQMLHVCMCKLMHLWPCRSVRPIVCGRRCSLAPTPPESSSRSIVISFTINLSQYDPQLPECPWGNEAHCCVDRHPFILVTGVQQGAPIPSVYAQGGGERWGAKMEMM